MKKFSFVIIICIASMIGLAACSSSSCDDASGYNSLEDENVAYESTISSNNVGIANSPNSTASAVRLTTVDQLVSRSTDIFRAEILDSRTELIRSGRVDELTMFYHLVHRLMVLEVFHGDTVVGDIIEISEVDWRLNERTNIHAMNALDPYEFAYGSEYIFFASSFRGTDFYPRPKSRGVVYRIPPSSASAFSDGIVAAYDENPEIADFALEFFVEIEDPIVLTVGDLILIRYEAGLGPRPHNLQPPEDVDRTRINETIAMAEFFLPLYGHLPGWDNVQTLLDEAIRVRDNPYSRQIQINPASFDLRYAMMTLGIETSNPLPSHTGTIHTAPWHLYPDGTLVIYPGTITWNTATSPWYSYTQLIRRIVIDGPLTAEAHLQGLFADLTHVYSIQGLDYLDTRAVTMMHGLFRNMHDLPILDLSGFNTANATNMNQMFAGVYLEELTLGENFIFHNLPNGHELREGYWKNAGIGAVPGGTYMLSTAELVTHQNANPTHETWIWVGDTPPAPAAILGDLNGDGVVNAADIILIRQYLMGITEGINSDAADINRDGVVNQLDHTLLTRHVSGVEIVPGVGYPITEPAPTGFSQGFAPFTTFSASGDFAVELEIVDITAGSVYVQVSVTGNPGIHTAHLALVASNPSVTSAGWVSGAFADLFDHDVLLAPGSSEAHIHLWLPHSLLTSDIWNEYATGVLGTVRFDIPAGLTEAFEISLESGLGGIYGIDESLLELIPHSLVISGPVAVAS